MKREVYRENPTRPIFGGIYFYAHFSSANIINSLWNFLVSSFSSIKLGFFCYFCDFV